jgi:hypothetical protein
MPIWFGRSGSRRFAPVTWQGWVIAALAVAILLASRIFFHPQGWGLPPWTRPVLGIGAVIIFLLVAMATSEPEA